MSALTGDSSDDWIPQAEKEQVHIPITTEEASRIADFEAGKDIFKGKKTKVVPLVYNK